MNFVTVCLLVLAQTSLRSCRTHHSVSLIHDATPDLAVVTPHTVPTLAQLIPILEGQDPPKIKIRKLKKLIPIYDELNKWRIENNKRLVEILPFQKKVKPLTLILAGNKFIKVKPDNNNDIKKTLIKPKQSQNNNQNHENSHTIDENSDYSDTENEINRTNESIEDANARSHVYNIHLNSNKHIGKQNGLAHESPSNTVFPVNEDLSHPHFTSHMIPSLNAHSKPISDYQKIKIFPAKSDVQSLTNVNKLDANENSLDINSVSISSEGTSETVESIEMDENADSKKPLHETSVNNEKESVPEESENMIVESVSSESISSESDYSDDISSDIRESDESESNSMNGVEHEELYSESDYESSQNYESNSIYESDFDYSDFKSDMSINTYEDNVFDVNDDSEVNSNEKLFDFKPMIDFTSDVDSSYDSLKSVSDETLIDKSIYESNTNELMVDSESKSSSISNEDKDAYFPLEYKLKQIHNDNTNPDHQESNNSNEYEYSSESESSKSYESSELESTDELYSKIEPNVLGNAKHIHNHNENGDNYYVAKDGDNYYVAKDGELVKVGDDIHENKALPRSEVTEHHIKHKHVHNYVDDVELGEIYENNDHKLIPVNEDHITEETKENALENHHHHHHHEQHHHHHHNNKESGMFVNENYILEPFNQHIALEEQISSVSDDDFDEAINGDDMPVFRVELTKKDHNNDDIPVTPTHHDEIKEFDIENVQRTPTVQYFVEEYFDEADTDTKVSNKHNDAIITGKNILTEEINENDVTTNVNANKHILLVKEGIITELDQGKQINEIPIDLNYEILDAMKKQSLEPVTNIYKKTADFKDCNAMDPKETKNKKTYKLSFIFN